jgi:hypothetical protein
MGFFSADRATREYADRIWNLKPITLWKCSDMQIKWKINKILFENILKWCFLWGGIYYYYYYCHLFS